MSELKTNKISTNDQNNVAIDNALNLKSYTEVQRDALTAVAGDMIYNTDSTSPEFYNGSSWEVLKTPTVTQVDYLIIAGGGSGGNGQDSAANGGGGGAGGYRTTWNSESNGGGSSTETPLTTIDTQTNYTVSVGAGGAQNSYENGGDSYFRNTNTGLDITSKGGGSGGGWSSVAAASGGSGGGAGGGGSNGASALTSPTVQGYGGGAMEGASPYRAGGGGGAGEAGDTDGKSAGGDGLASTITGSSFTRGGGGGGAGDGSLFPAGEGGGANGVTYTSGSHPVAATANTGGGGGGGASRSYNKYGSQGGSGVIIFRYPNSYSITFGAGVIGTESATGSDKYAVITGGTGTVSWS